MKKTILSLFAVILLFAATGYSQTEYSKGTITFIVKGFEDNSGQVFINLYRINDDIPTKPFKTVVAKITDKKAVVKINNLTYGSYAAIIVHDKNKDGEIEHSWGFPSEPLAFSNNWELSLFSGMPSFKKLKFTFSPIKNNYTITFKN